MLLNLEGISTLNVAYIQQIASAYIRLHLYFHIKMVCIPGVSHMMPHTHCECILFFLIWRVFSTLNVTYTPRLASEYIQLHLYLHINMVSIVGFYIWIAISTLHRATLGP